MQRFLADEEDQQIVANNDMNFPHGFAPRTVPYQAMHRCGDKQLGNFEVAGFRIQDSYLEERIEVKDEL